MDPRQSHKPNPGATPPFTIPPGFSSLAHPTMKHAPQKPLSKAIHFTHLPQFPPPLFLCPETPALPPALFLHPSIISREPLLPLEPSAHAHTFFLSLEQTGLLIRADSQTCMHPYTLPPSPVCILTLLCLHLHERACLLRIRAGGCSQPLPLLVYVPSTCTQTPLHQQVSWAVGRLI